MKTHRHITIEEIFALTDGNWEMFPEFIKDTTECSECRNLIQKYSDIRAVLVSNKHLTCFPDPKKINEIAEKSFLLLHEEIPEKKKTLSELVVDFLKSALKPLAVTAVAAALVIAVYHAEFRTNTVKTAEADNEIQEQNDFSKPFQFNGIEKKGTSFKNGIAEISTLTDTHLEAVSDNEIKMSSGKAKFDVVSGNDFRITVDGKFIVRVLGTSFTLEYDKHDLKVAVLNGLVEIIRFDDNSTAALSADMAQTFPVSNIAAVVKNEKQILLKHKVMKMNIHPKLDITPDASFLIQGREALKSGNNGAALQLFALEMEKGKEKDKALFEAVKIYENSGRQQDAVNLISGHRDIMKASRVYKEELLIKGCFSQYKMKSGDLSFCKEYIKTFPNGYRKNEILGMIGANE